MEDLITYIGKGIVSHPDDFKVDKKVEGDVDLYNLTVNQDDFGQVIGRQGRTARALRAIARAAAARTGRRAQVEILE